MFESLIVFDMKGMNLVNRNVSQLICFFWCKGDCDPTLLLYRCFVGLLLLNNYILILSLLLRHSQSFEIRCSYIG